MRSALLNHFAGMQLQRPLQRYRERSPTDFPLPPDVCPHDSPQPQQQQQVFALCLEHSTLLYTSEAWCEVAFVCFSVIVVVVVVVTIAAFGCWVIAGGNNNNNRCLQWFIARPQLRHSIGCREWQIWLETATVMAMIRLSFIPASLFFSTSLSVLIERNVCKWRPAAMLTKWKVQFVNLG